MTSKAIRGANIETIRTYIKDHINLNDYELYGVPFEDEDIEYILEKMQDGESMEHAVVDYLQSMQEAMNEELSRMEN